MHSTLNFDSFGQNHPAPRLALRRLNILTTQGESRFLAKTPFLLHFFSIFDIISTIFTGSRNQEIFMTQKNTDEFMKDPESVVFMRTVISPFMDLPERYFVSTIARLKEMFPAQFYSTGLPRQAPGQIFTHVFPPEEPRGTTADFCAAAGNNVIGTLTRYIFDKFKALSDPEKVEAFRTLQEIFPPQYETARYLSFPTTPPAAARGAQL